MDRTVLVVLVIAAAVILVLRPRTAKASSGTSGAPPSPAPPPTPSGGSAVSGYAGDASSSSTAPTPATDSPVLRKDSVLTQTAAALGGVSGTSAPSSSSSDVKLSTVTKEGTFTTIAGPQPIRPPLPGDDLIRGWRRLVAQTKRGPVTLSIPTTQAQDPMPTIQEWAAYDQQNKVSL